MRSIFVLLFLCCSIGICRAQGEHIDWARDKTCQMVFQAVLEGLYSDGVSNEAVDAIIPPGDKQFSMHFVYSCPLCHPAYEAFKLYRSRPNFFGRKDDKDTFGAGLSPSVMKHLLSKDRGERLECIQELIQTWVQRRLDSMRLTSEERGEWSDALKYRMKMGMLAMENADFGAKECAICRGSFEGAANPVKPQVVEPKPIRPPSAPKQTDKEF